MVAAAALIDPRATAKKVVLKVAEFIDPRVGPIERKILRMKIREVVRDIEEQPLNERLDTYRLLLGIHKDIEEGLHLGKTNDTKTAHNKNS